MKKLSIVVPVYFNEKSLPDLFIRLEQLGKRLSKKNVKLDLIFVDDGSGDSSLAILKKYRKKSRMTTVIKLTRNFGANAASKTGMRYAKGDAFMTLAADLQDPPEVVDEMVDHWLKGSKFVIAERISRTDPLFSKLFSKLYYFLLRFMVLPDYPKGGYDMALMARDFHTIVTQSSKNGLTPLVAWWLGHKPAVVHYVRQEREHGVSRWTFAKKFHTFLDVMLGFSITPIRMISAVGVVVSILSFVFGLAVSVSAFFGINPVQGFPTIVSLITFLLGLIILMLGVIGEYLWRIFEETNHRPETVIDEVY